MRNTIVCCLMCAVTVFGSPVKYYKNYLKEPAVQRFREYLQINTSLEENLIYAVEFWKRQAYELNLPIRVYKPQGKPAVVITVLGTDPNLPSIMLNSHMDVVYADETEWIYPPYAAVMDKNGDIFGRGAQDTKDVGIQYMEAVRRFKRDNVTLLRTLHITVMPDEETGGYEGMKTFIDTDDFRSLNVGFAFDEGMTAADGVLYANYEDRRPWQMEFIVHGEGGHGFTMPDDPAMAKAQRLINIIMKYRDEQIKIKKSKHSTDYGAYTSLNINVVHGGSVPNVIPSTMSLVADMRLASDAKAADVDSLVQLWLNEAGNGTELNFIRREDVSGTTQLDDSNPFWVAMRETVNNLGYTIEPIVCPATTDMLALRNRGIPAIGFSTKTNTISRIHAKNEYLNVVTFLKGIDIYEEIIKSVANLPPQVHSVRNGLN